MKKRTLSILLCLLLALVCVFAFAACGGKNDDPDENEGGDDHVHAYTDTVTAPTCVADGYTTRTCACGDTQTVSPTPKTGIHTYNSKVLRQPTTLAAGQRQCTCTVCGDSKVEDIAVVTTFALPGVAEKLAAFFPQGTISFVTASEDPIFFDITNKYSRDLVELFCTCENDEYKCRAELEETYSPGPDWETSESIRIALTTATFTVEGEDITGTVVVSLFYQYEDATDELLEISFYMENENISVEISDDEEDFVLSDMFYESLAEMLDLTKAELTDIFYQASQFETYLPIVEAMGNMLAGELDKAVAKLPTEMPESPSIFDSFDMEDLYTTTTEGDYTTYTVNLGALLSIYAAYGEGTYADMMDAVYGEGFTEKMLTFAETAVEMTIGDITDAVITLSETYDIDLDAIYALLNGFVYSMTGESFNFEAEINKNANLTLAELADVDADEFKAALAEATDYMTTMTVAEMMHHTGCATDPDCDHSAAECTMFEDMLDYAEAMLDEMVSFQFVLHGDVFVEMLIEVFDENGDALCALEMEYDEEYNAYDIEYTDKYGYDFYAYVCESEVYFSLYDDEYCILGIDIQGATDPTFQFGVRVWTDGIECDAFDYALIMMENGADLTVMVKDFMGDDPVTVVSAVFDFTEDDPDALVGISFTYYEMEGSLTYITESGNTVYTLTLDGENIATLTVSPDGAVLSVSYEGDTCNLSCNTVENVTTLTVSLNGESLLTVSANTAENTLTLSLNEMWLPLGTYTYEDIQESYNYPELEGVYKIENTQTALVSGTLVISFTPATAN